MQLTIKKKIGKETYTFIVEGQNLFETLMESNKLSFGNVEKCGLCGGDNLVLGAHLGKDKFKYADIKCLNYDCRASLTFGNRADDPNTYYLRKEDSDKKGQDGKIIKQYAWKPFKIDE